MLFVELNWLWIKFTLLTFLYFTLSNFFSLLYFIQFIDEYIKHLSFPQYFAFRFNFHLIFFFAKPQLSINHIGSDHGLALNLCIYKSHRSYHPSMDKAKPMCFLHKLRRTVTTTKLTVGLLTHTECTKCKIVCNMYLFIAGKCGWDYVYTAMIT